MVFRFGMTIAFECAKCGRVRDLPDEGEAAMLMRGDRSAVVQLAEPCPQCGDRRARFTPRFAAEKPPRK